MNLAAKVTDSIGLTSATDREFNSLSPDSKRAIETLRQLAAVAQTPWRVVDAIAPVGIRGNNGFAIEANGRTYEVFESFGLHHHDFGFRVTERGKEIAGGRESRCAQQIFETIRFNQEISQRTMPSGFRV